MTKTAQVEPVSIRVEAHGVNHARMPDEYNIEMQETVVLTCTSRTHFMTAVDSMKTRIRPMI